jgi:predicted DsbA family dithiol-disulfide isomerase
MNNKISVEIVSDLVCPWCYVGKKRVEKAIGMRPDLDIEVSWLPFQLSPDMPREGRKRIDHYKEIFGAARAEVIMSSMKDTGVEEGIEFGSSPDAMSPNTLSAHVLMLWAQEAEKVDANELAEKLFHAHHVACEDIGDHAVLTRIAAEAGMDADEAARLLASAVDEARITELFRESQARGVSGVPFFIINGRYGLSGAQPAETLAAAFEQIAKEDTIELKSGSQAQ